MPSTFNVWRAMLSPVLFAQRSDISRTGMKDDCTLHLAVRRCYASLPEGEIQDVGETLLRLIFPARALAAVVFHVVSDA